MEKTKQFRFISVCFYDYEMLFCYSGLLHQPIPSWHSDRLWRNSMMRVGCQGEKRDTKTTELCWRKEWLRWVLRSSFLSSMLATLSPASTIQNTPTFHLRNFTKSSQILVGNFCVCSPLFQLTICIHLVLDQVIYPGKVTEAPCFRIGNIGHVSTKDMEHLLHCIKIVLKEMQIPLPVVWLMVKVSFLFILELF